MANYVLALLQDQLEATRASLEIARKGTSAARAALAQRVERQEMLEERERQLSAHIEMLQDGKKL